MSESTAYNNKGVVLGELKRHDEALAACDQAIRLNPKDSRAFYNKGVVLIRLVRHEEALAAYKKAEELDPSDRDAKSKREELEEIIKGKIGKDFLRDY